MFKLEIETGNEAFTDVPGHEVAEILDRVTDLLRDGVKGGRLFDVNGNDVGSWKLSG